MAAGWDVWANPADPPVICLGLTCRWYLGRRCHGESWQSSAVWGVWKPQGPCFLQQHPPPPPYTHSCLFATNNMRCLFIVSSGSLDLIGSYSKAWSWVWVWSVKVQLAHSGAACTRITRLKVWSWTLYDCLKPAVDDAPDMSWVSCQTTCSWVPLMALGTGS